MVVAALLRMPFRPFYSTMLMFGCIGACALQFGLKRAKADDALAFNVKMVGMGASALGVCLYPPGGPEHPENWMWLVGCGAVFCSGGFALLLGAAVEEYGALDVRNTLVVVMVACFIMRFCVVWIRSNR
eukprot:COSAG03_NODE_1571_length_3861_cov_2.247741_2_plen_129_part_00